MQAFVHLRAVVVPIDRANVDTDAIIPKQFMKSIQRSGFGDNLFDEWRYLDRGEPGHDVSARPRNPDFALNQGRYAGAGILLSRENFGCGSSREHAVWALRDYGIRVLIAPSFADIFYGNCFKNGLLPINLDAASVDHLFERVHEQPAYALEINLPEQTVATPEGKTLHFEVDPALKHRLLNGLDDIEITLQQADKIRLYEQRRKTLEPWIFN